jgi:hypothetical protein
MAARINWRIGLLLAIAGCQAITPAQQDSPSASSDSPAFVVRALEPESAPEAQRGSTAGWQPAPRMRPTHVGLATEPGGVNHLTMAASRLEKGDEAGACAHLALYLVSHPEHAVVRIHFAELLLRQNHPDAAREQFERFEAEAQEQPGVSVSQRIRCESRLAKMAEWREDEYEEHLHRGIGLYLLALDRIGQPDDKRELRVESLLFKAASELTKARSIHPDEARPHWYLHEVWSRLGQRHAALRRLKAAEAAADFTYLTPTEHRNLLLARQRTQRSRPI